ncbi:MAG: hypothetical protein HQL42_11555 [Alphaproteobacteria bacterium]|nr:hypothetical protein [Alphaproteobacteria bacterium]
MKKSLTAVALLSAALLLGGNVAPTAAAEMKISEACPAYRGEDDRHCPPAQSLAWLACPAFWPKDGKTPLSFATPHPINGQNYSRPDWTRKDFERESRGFYLDCQYGAREGHKGVREHLTVVVPIPVVQYGRRRVGSGWEIGFTVLRDHAPAHPEMLFPEPLDGKTRLEGIALGFGREEASSLAAGQASETSEGQITFSREGRQVAITLDPQSQRVRMVAITVAGSDDVAVLRQLAVRRFGFNWSGEFDEGEKRWMSADKRFAVEFRRNSTTEAASLRLFVLR